MTQTKRAHGDETRWVWMDMEMSGLDDETCAILEVAVIVTTPALDELAQLELAIWQPEASLQTMEPFVRAMHTQNGLLDKVRSSDVSLRQAEIKLMRLLTKHVPYQQGILAGNSVWQDRRFLKRYLPLVESYLHYRQIDVSTFKVLAQCWYGDKGVAPEKKSTHTALEDIRGSIQELRFYRETFLVPG